MQKKTEPITFELGLLESSEDSVIPNGFASVLENYVPEITGGLRCRRGWLNSSATGAPATRRAKGIGTFSVDNVTGDVKTKVGSFAARTSTGSTAVTGVGFLPKALILWTAGSPTSAAFAASHRRAVGFSTSTSARYSISSASEDGAADSNTGREMASVALVVVNPAGTEDGVYDLTSFDADGFTLNCTNAFGAAYVVNYLALGGDEVSAANVVTWLDNGSTGNQAVTGAGFQPDLVLHLGASLTGTGTQTGTDAKFSFGAMDASGNQWCNALFAADASASSNTARYQRIDKCLAALASALSKSQEATFVSMDSDGFTINKTTALSNVRMFSLCIKFGDLGVGKVGSFTKPTGAAPVTQAVTGVGFTPLGVMATSLHHAAATTIQADVSWSLGGASGATEEKGIAMRDDDSVATMDVQGYQNDFFISLIDEATSSTLDAQYNLSAFGTDGFTGSWSTNDSTASEVCYLAIGALAGAGVDKILVAHNDTTEFDILALAKSQLASGTWAAVESVTVTDPTSMVAFAAGLGVTLYTHKKFATGRYWDGTTAASITDAPPGRCLAFHKNHFFIGGSEANPTRLYFSELGSYTSWPATYYIDVGKDDGEAIEDIALFEEGLVVAKRNSLWFLSGSGPDDFTIHRLNAGGGAPGRCIAPTPFGAVIAGNNAIYLWTGAGVETVSNPVEDSYEATGNYVSAAYAYGMVYVCDEGTGTIWNLDLQRGSWTTEKVSSANEGPALIARLADDLLLYGAKQATTTSLVAYRETPKGPRARDANLAQTFKAYTPEYWLGGPENQVTPMYLYIRVRQRGGDAADTGLTITPVYDGVAQSPRLLGGYTIGPEAAAGTYRYKLSINAGKARINSMLFRFEQTVASDEAALMDIEEVTLVYEVQEQF